MSAARVKVLIAGTQYQLYSLFALLIPRKWCNSSTQSIGSLSVLQIVQNLFSPSKKPVFLVSLLLLSVLIQKDVIRERLTVVSRTLPNQTNCLE